METIEGYGLNEGPKADFLDMTIHKSLEVLNENNKTLSMIPGLHGENYILLGPAKISPPHRSPEFRFIHRGHRENRKRGRF